VYCFQGDNHGVVAAAIRRREIASTAIRSLEYANEWKNKINDYCSGTWL